jgi:hypothetical protein
MVCIRVSGGPHFVGIVKSRPRQVRAKEETSRRTYKYDKHAVIDK